MNLTENPIDNKIASYSPLIFFIFGFITIILLAYLLLFYDFNKDEIFQKYKDTETKLKNNNLSSLLNSSGINNIPNLNIVSSNPAVTNANRCGAGPVYIGTGIGSDTDCIRTCVNDNAHVINITNENEIAIYKNIQLAKGAHCTIGPRPQCNMRTSIALMTINSVVCKSKFPRLVGGKLGDKIIACNNNLINDPQNILWDYKYNNRFDPWITTIIDEDEKLEDGTYRFSCKYNGEDSKGNRYQAHPYDRLHPIRNHCASLIHRAHPSIKTIWDSEYETYSCDCGDEKITRASHLHSNNSKSICTTFKIGHKDLDSNKKILTIPYKCFNLFSTINEVAESFPCPPEQFTRNGSQIATVDLVVSESPDIIIEHPEYNKLPKSKRVKVFKNRFLDF